MIGITCPPSLLRLRAKRYGETSTKLKERSRERRRMMRARNEETIS